VPSWAPALLHGSYCKLDTGGRLHRGRERRTWYGPNRGNRPCWSAELDVRAPHRGARPVRFDAKAMAKPRQAMGSRAKDVGYLHACGAASRGTRPDCRHGSQVGTPAARQLVYPFQHTTSRTR